MTKVARLMANVKESDNEEFWKAMLIDKVDCLVSELRLIKYLI